MGSGSALEALRDDALYKYTSLYCDVRRYNVVSGGEI